MTSGTRSNSIDSDRTAHLLPLVIIRLRWLTGVVIMTLMSNTTKATDILQAACSSKGFTCLFSHTDSYTDLAETLQDRGLLTLTCETVQIDEFNFFGEIVPAHSETKLTYRATDAGRAKWLAGTCLA